MFQTKHILCSVTSFFYRAVYEIMWENILERGGPQMTIWRTRIACWIPKATNTHSGFVILIAFPQQQWLHERSSVLYVHCLSCIFYSAVEKRVVSCNFHLNWVLLLIRYQTMGMCGTGNV